MKILALCGSLRSASLSAALLRATARLAPPPLCVDIQARLGELPLFNPDLEPSAPAAVNNLWNAVTSADAILIASPEYAHGVTGTIKNTLDWLVGHVPFAHMPVAVFNPAMDALHADSAIKETLRTMSADLIDGACLRIPVIGSGLTEDGMVASPEISAAIHAALDAITRHLRASSAALADA